ncbi:MAG: LPP20 family lipoprotein [Proteobacteria bacterium]|nr:LPP20 family lipoprotein [Pseudomonadota bacterium]
MLMKQMGWVLGIIGFLCCVSACVHHAPVIDCKTPAWYSETGGGGGIKTGVGEGESLDAASASAMSDISTQISTWILTESQSLAVRNGSVSESSFRNKVELESKHRLNNAKRLKMEQCGSRYYVKYAVDLRSPAVMMAEALKSEYFGKTIRFTGSSAIIGSPFADAVKRFMAQTVESSNESEAQVPLDLTFTDGIWCVHAGHISIPVFDVADAVNLGVYVKGDIQFGICDRNGVARSTLLKAGDEFCFSVSGSHGFLSIFNLYADGRVNLVATNCPVSKGRMIYPDPAKDHYVLEASTISPNFSSVDTYIVVICPSIKDMSIFSTLPENGKAISGEDSFSAHILARWLDGMQQKQVAMLKTRTEP